MGVGVCLSVCLYLGWVNVSVEVGVGGAFTRMSMHVCERGLATFVVMTLYCLFLASLCQTYRECVRLSAGSGLKVHVLTKAKATANTFGLGSTQRFGEPWLCQ